MSTSLADWSDEQLNSLRLRTDPVADQLVAKLYDQPGPGGSDFGRLGYNHFLNLTDKMQEAPELVFTNGSELHRQLQAMPQEFVDYFDPLELPAWVQPEKLNLANTMWTDNSLGMLVTLLLGSLPACYLMARGIPALYQTEKLSNRAYISQRIYETGLMLDAVMGDCGFQVLTDVGATVNDHTHSALNRLDPAGDWVKEGRSIRRRSEAPAPAISKEDLARTIADLHESSPPKKFLWGSGYITVKKVRFLHASMGYMLKHPGRVKPPGAAGRPGNLAHVIAQRTEAWDVANLGEPVNQEDLGYTLLTFGYVIISGLEHWGWQFTADQKHAFLHLWRVVGHVLGIEADLMTDDWDEAGRIFHRLQRHQAMASPDGIELTSPVMEFLEAYLPNYFGIPKMLPPLAIRDLVGPEADKLFAPSVLRDVRRPTRRALWWGIRLGLRTFGRIRHQILPIFPGVGGVFASLLYRTSEGLIESCRSAYTRKPFYVPLNATTWTPQQGVSPEFMVTLHRWRQRVFNWVFFALGTLIAGVLGIGAGVTLWFLSHEAAWLAALASAVCLIASYMTMDHELPAVLAQRPRINEKPTGSTA